MNNEIIQVAEGVNLKFVLSVVVVALGLMLTTFVSNVMARIDLQNELNDMNQHAMLQNQTNAMMNKTNACLAKTPHNDTCWTNP